MSDPIPKTFKPRFPLFGKVMVGFIFIIVFMILSSTFVLLQLKGAFTTGKGDLQGNEKNNVFSIRLAKTLLLESEAVRTYHVTKDSTVFLTYLREKKEFETIHDSLHASASRLEIKSLLSKISEYHNQFNDISAQIIWDTSLDSNIDVTPKISRSVELQDSLSQVIQMLNDAYRFSLGKTVSSFDKRINLAMDTAVIILLLSLVVALVTAILITRTVVRPIQALKDATEKVSEGHYEIIPISSTDEIADLTRDFNQMSNKLKQLDDMRVTLMSEISHEMRTPLQVIKAGCHAITKTKEAAPLVQRQIDAVAMINQATNRINRFVTSFLDITKMESGLMKFEFIPTDVVELITPLVQEAQLIGQTRQITVDFIHDDIKPLALDREKFTQVVSNLISNAIKYTRENGKITIRALKTFEMNGSVNSKEFIRIDVQDTGVGIPPADVEKLFTKFFQANNKSVVSEKGSGLGLALVKHVAEAHGGKVAVSSRLNEGSTFSVLIPSEVRTQTSA
ncbi:MAG: HAMP domain-containing histidine kinase [Ignavibacteriae bacterium]|nr:HAMP domain-containing histidine kinase [Ignavibacteriota bacterium]